MFEVEKKFVFRKQDIKRLVEGAKYLGEQTYTDTYYDTKYFDLTTHDIWLRKRGKIFQLKIPTINQGRAGELFDQYQELTREQEIRKFLHIPVKGRLERDLQNNGYIPCATFISTRKSYKNGDFTIDLDITDFGYSIGEIELMVKDKSYIKEGIERVKNFAKDHNLKISPVSGKLIEYLRRNSQGHYQALVRSGIVKPAPLHL